MTIICSVDILCNNPREMIPILYSTIVQKVLAATVAPSVDCELVGGVGLLNLLLA